MKVLLTGATGFIGSHVARELLRAGCDLHAVVRESSDLWRIRDIASNLQLVKCDLLDEGELARHLERIRPEMCIHLAWYGEPGKYLTSTVNLEMLQASIRLALNLSRLGCRRFVGAGTCFEYELTGDYLSETSRTNPSTMYAASKLALALVLEQLANTSDMDVAWTRIFYQYGPAEDDRRLVPSVVLPLLSGREALTTKGEQIRDYLHVEDVASAIWAVAASDLSGPVNVGSGRPMAVRKIVTTLGEIAGRPELVRLGALPYRDSDPMFVCANNLLLTETTGWVPRYSLEEGLKDTVAWWRDSNGRREPMRQADA